MINFKPGEFVFHRVTLATGWVQYESYPDPRTMYVYVSRHIGAQIWNKEDVQRFEDDVCEIPL